MLNLVLQIKTIPDPFAQGLVTVDTRQSYYLEKAPDAPGVYMQTACKTSGVSSAINLAIDY